MLDNLDPYIPEEDLMKVVKVIALYALIFGVMIYAIGL
nr:MAG: hypothetical protein CM15mV30_0120 [uncultured marine virus]